VLITLAHVSGVTVGGTIRKRAKKSVAFSTLRQAAALVLLPCASFATGSTDIDWMTPISGQWIDAVNWSGFNVPNALTENARLLANGNDYTVSLAASVAIDSLKLGTTNASLDIASGATLTANEVMVSVGTLIIAGSVSTAAPTDTSKTVFTYSGGTINGNVTINGGRMYLAPAGVSSGTFTIARSTAILANTGDKSIIPSGVTFVLDASSAQASGLFNQNLVMENDGVIRVAGSNAAGGTGIFTEWFENRGSINVEPGLSSTITPLAGHRGRFYNRSTGTLTVGRNAGVFYGGIQNEGAITVSPGASLMLGGYTQLSGSLSGKVEIFGAFEWLGGSFSGTLIGNSSSITLPPTAGTFDITMKGKDSWLSSSNDLPLFIDPSSILRVRGVLGKSSTVVTNLVPIVNEGTIILDCPDGDADAILNGEAITNNGTIITQPGPYGGGFHRFYANNSPTGSIVANSNLITSFMTNAGTITLAAGRTFHLSYFTQTNGTLTIGANADIHCNRFDFNGGVINFSSGATFDGGLNYNGGAVNGKFEISVGYVAFMNAPSEPVSFRLISAGIGDHNGNGANVPAQVTLTSQVASVFSNVVSSGDWHVLAKTAPGGTPPGIVSTGPFVFTNNGSFSVDPDSVQNIAATLAGSVVNSATGTIAVNQDTIIDGELVNHGVVTIAPGKKLTFSQRRALSGNGSLNLGAGAKVLAADGIRQYSLTTSGLVEISVTSTKSSRLAHLTLNGAGTLNLQRTNLILDYPDQPGASPLADIRAKLISGRNEGNWRGVGIIGDVQASFALGYAENSALAAPFSTFTGESVDSSCVLVRYTLGADADLDAIVNQRDLEIAGANFLSPTSSHWYLGDFDYDGMCDEDDVLLLGLLYEQNAPVPSHGDLVSRYGEQFTQAFEAGRSQVPEPASLFAIGIGFCARRRRA
jgi:hypothetical protein